MEFLVERVFAGLLAVLCPLLTIFDLPGNSILLLSGLGFAFFDEAMSAFSFVEELKSPRPS